MFVLVSAVGSKKAANIYSRLEEASLVLR